MKMPRLLALIAVFVTASVAHAGFYVKGSAFYNDPGDIQVNSTSAFKSSLKSNVGYAGSVGFKFSFLRLEAELQNFKSGVSDGTTGTGVATASGSLKEFNGFANLYLDIPPVLSLSPFVGVGLGYANVNFDNVNANQGTSQVVKFSGKDTVFGYQVIAGIQLHLFGAATLHAGYRIVKREDVAMNNLISNAQQTVSLGTSRRFEIGVAVGF